MSLPATKRGPCPVCKTADSTIGASKSMHRLVQSLLGILLLLTANPWCAWALPTPSPDIVKTPDTMRIEGRVVGSSKSTKGMYVIQINLGQQVEVSDVLEVYRASRLIGKIAVVQIIDTVTSGSRAPARACQMRAGVVPLGCEPLRPGDIVAGCPARSREKTGFSDAEMKAARGRYPEYRQVASQIIQGLYGGSESMQAVMPQAKRLVAFCRERPERDYRSFKLLRSAINNAELYVSCLASMLVNGSNRDYHRFITNGDAITTLAQELKDLLPKAEAALSDGE